MGVATEAVENLDVLSLVVEGVTDGLSLVGGRGCRERTLEALGSEAVIGQVLAVHERHVEKGALPRGQPGIVASTERAPQDLTCRGIKGEGARVLPKDVPGHLIEEEDEGERPVRAGFPVREGSGRRGRHRPLELLL